VGRIRLDPQPAQLWPATLRCICQGKAFEGLRSGLYVGTCRRKLMFMTWDQRQRYYSPAPSTSFPKPPASTPPWDSIIYLDNTQRSTPPRLTSPAKNTLFNLPLTTKPSRSRYRMCCLPSSLPLPSLSMWLVNSMRTTVLLPRIKTSSDLEETVGLVGEMLAGYMRQDR
jgi:hypothetical protein